MPINLSNNNRVIPANSRQVDVAVSTLNRLIPIQNRKYDNAFRVQGFQSVLYHKHNSGEPCLCQSKVSQVKSRLDREGNADQGLINEILSGGQEFGYRPYGLSAKPSPTQVFNTLEVKLPSAFDTPGLYKTDNDKTNFAPIGSFLDRYSTDANDPSATTIVSDGNGVKGPVGFTDQVNDLLESSSFDIGLLPYSDVSCPICFGTGYVGGYSTFNGWRRVLVPQSATTFDGFLHTEEEVPSAEATSISWLVTFPAHVIAVDSFKLLNEITPITDSVISIDGTVITSELLVLKFCDGLPHTVKVIFNEQNMTFTHVEIQLNQSFEWANFEFPKLSKSSSQALLDSTDPFSIVVSPMVPHINPLDVIVESTYGKYLQVKSVSSWNDRQRSVLGWEVEVRVTQPQELYHQLPLRRKLEAANRPAFVRDNSDGSRRT